MLFTINTYTNLHTWELNRYGWRQRRTTTTDDDDGRRRRTTTNFKYFHCIDKPIGASPRRDYVVKDGISTNNLVLTLYFLGRLLERTNLNLPCKKRKQPTSFLRHKRKQPTSFFRHKSRLSVFLFSSLSPCRKKKSLPMREDKANTNLDKNLDRFFSCWRTLPWDLCSNLAV